MCGFLYFFFFKQKTAYEMRISDWSSDVCSSDLLALATRTIAIEHQVVGGAHRISERVGDRDSALFRQAHPQVLEQILGGVARAAHGQEPHDAVAVGEQYAFDAGCGVRSEEGRGGTKWVSPCRYRWWPDH